MLNVATIHPLYLYPHPTINSKGKDNTHSPQPIELQEHNQQLNPIPISPTTATTIAIKVQGIQKRRVLGARILIAQNDQPGFFYRGTLKDVLM